MHAPQIEAIGGFLSAIDFKYFCTFTTRKPVSIASTRKIAEAVGKFIGAGNESSYFWASEKFDVREGYHFHALMNTPHHQIEIFNWYYPRYGRCQIINNHDQEKRFAASYYCSKYITKELADYDFHLSTEIKTRNQQHTGL